LQKTLKLGVRVRSQQKYLANHANNGDWPFTFVKKASKVEITLVNCFPNHGDQPVTLA
jgi:hypothetical protein